MDRAEPPVPPSGPSAQWVVLALGGLLTLALAGWTRQLQVGRTASRLEADAATIRQDLVQTFQNYEEVMLGLRGLVLAKGDLDLATLHAYVTDLDLFSRHPGLLSLSFGYFLDGAARAPFERRLTREWAPRGVPFAIRPTGQRDRYFVIAYGEPIKANVNFIGTDTLAIPGNPSSLEQAVATGRVVASGPMRVVQYQGPDPGMLLRLAVPRRGPSTLDPGRGGALGCINCVFRVSLLVQDALGEANLARANVWIVDGGPSLGSSSPAVAPLTVYGAAPAPHSLLERFLKPSPTSVHTLDLCGRRWEVRTTIRSPFLGEQEWLQPFGVALVGLLATLLVAGIIHSQSRLGQRARTLAERMTRQFKEVGLELQRSQAKLASVLESTTDLVWSVDRSYRLLTFNATLERHLLTSYGTRPAVGGTLGECLPEARAAGWPALYERALNEGSFQREYSLVNGHILDLALHPILQGDEVVGVSIFGKDISERKEAEAFLRASEEKFRNIVNRAPMGIFRRDLEGRFVYTSPGLWKEFDCASEEEFLRDYALASQRWTHPKRHEAFKALLQRDGKVEGFENEATLRSGKVRWHLLFVYLDQNDPGYCDGFSVDITSLKEAEAERAKIKEQLHQSQKMDAIGQLAGGVAHDFNNMLAGIIGAAELLADEAGSLPPEKKDKYLNLILTMATRAGDLTRKLLATSRTDPGAFSPQDLGTIIQDVATILERTLDRRITITTAIPAEHPWVLGNASMLSNIFMNMGINAGHAMPDGGTLAFQLRNLHLDPAFCAGSPFALQPGPYVEVEVRDNGSGMAETIRNRIFEPFFTTKAPGKGTGLGLAVAYGTIQDHGGAIHVYSEEGVGTVFHIYLPLSGDQTREKAEEAQGVPGTGTILVVDDEEVLRITTGAMLGRLGYTVLTAANGWEAVACFREAHGRIDLVILDMIMPIMSGRQAFERMQAIDGKVPVLLASGFSKEEDLAEMTRAGRCEFIRKPYRINELSTTVARILKDRTPG